MKQGIFVSSVVLIMLFGGLSSAHATSFNWSYTFASGNVLSGMLDGTINNLDPNIVDWDEEIFTIVFSTESGDTVFGNDPFRVTVAALTVDGSSVELLWRQDDPSLNFSLDAVDGVRAAVRVRVGRGGAGFELDDSEAWSPANWSITPKAVAAVPEPATFMLFGTGLVGLLAWRARRRT